MIPNEEIGEVEEGANIQLVKNPSPEKKDVEVNCGKKIITACMTKLCSRNFLKTFLIGQFLSILLCGTGVTSGLLQQYGVNTPTAQCFLNYILLGVVFGGYLACRSSERTLCYILKTQGWKYFLLAFIDVEANFLFVKAYSYTTITSVQILDSFTIPVVMILSYIVLRVKYTLYHISGALVCIFGIGGLILADVLSGNHSDDTNSNNRILGDILCICGAVFYSISNVGEEYVVKNFARSEFLAMIGIFGSFISGIQAIILEINGFNGVDFWTFKILLPWIAYAICLFLLYTVMTVGIQFTSAAAINLALLSADFYSLLFGIFLFNYSFYFLYFIAMVFILTGIILFSIKDTLRRDPVPQSVDQPNS